VKSSKPVLALAGFKSNRCFAIEQLSPTGSQAYAIMVIIVLSILPGAFEFWRHRRKAE